jgi:hypothetical protein
MRRFGLAVAVLIFVGTGVLRADPPAAARAPGAAAPGDPKDSFAGALRSLLVDSLPSPLYEDKSHWGGQKDVARGVKWVRRDGIFRPELLRSEKNDGLWWRVRVTAPNPAGNLVLDLRDFRQPDPSRMTFTIFVAFDTDVEFERQRWDAGRRLFSGSTRARARVKLTLDCEATTRIEAGKKLLPDAVFRLRVLRSDFRYENLVFEHVAGVGGDAAKILGDAAHAAVSQWRPSLERRLIEKANAAIVKAGDTKEVRVGLGKVLGGG